MQGLDPKALMEDRPKFPYATYQVKLVPGDPGKCTLNPIILPNEDTTISARLPNVKVVSDKKHWIRKGSVRLPLD